VSRIGITLFVANAEVQTAFVVKRHVGITVYYEPINVFAFAELEVCQNESVRALVFGLGIVTVRVESLLVEDYAARFASIGKLGKLDQLLPYLEIFHRYSCRIERERGGLVVVKVGAGEILGIRVCRDTPIKISVSSAISREISKAVARGIVAHAVGLENMVGKIVVKGDVNSEACVVFSCDQMRQTKLLGVFLHIVGTRHSAAVVPGVLCVYLVADIHYSGAEQRAFRVSVARAEKVNASTVHI